MNPHVIITLSLAIAASQAAIAVAQPPAAPDGTATIAAIERMLVDVIARVEPSVVAVSRSVSARPETQENADIFDALRRDAVAESGEVVVGAGVFIDPGGLVLTHYLAVREGHGHLVTTTAGHPYSATVRAADPRSGLAVLAIDTTTATSPRRTGKPAAAPGSFPAIRIGDATSLGKGQFVVAIGNPYAIENDGQPTASWGIITNLARKAPPRTNFNDAPGPTADYRTTLHHLGTLIQTDAKVGWSAGGGALVNLRGELVGLTTTAATIAGHEQPAGYAIPMNATMRRVIDTLKQGREVEYGLLGVGFGQAILSATGDDRSHLRISQVYAGGPAARAGIEPGDVITSVGDAPVEDVDAVQLAISALPPSASAKIEYERSGGKMAAHVKLAKLAVAGKLIATVRPDAWLGIRVDYATALEADALAQAISSGAYDEEGCVLVTEVEPGSVAWRAGVRPGTFITHVGGQRVSTPDEFRAAAKKLGKKLDIRLQPPIASEVGAN